MVVKTRKLGSKKIKLQHHMQVNMIENLIIMQPIFVVVKVKSTDNQLVYIVVH